PSENRHFHKRHPLTAHLQNRDEKIDTRKRTSHPCKLHNPDPIIDPLIRTILHRRKRWIGEPASCRKMTDSQRDHEKGGSCGKEPKTNGVHEGKSDISCPNLEWDKTVHETKDNAHTDE